MLPIRHVRIDATLVSIAAWTCWVAKFVWMVVESDGDGSVLASSCSSDARARTSAERISGASRRMALRTVLKMLMQRRMGGKLDHGGASSQEKARQQSLATKHASRHEKKKKKRPPARSLY